MTWQIVFSLLVLVLICVGLVANIAPDALMIGAVISFAVAGIISPQEAFAGFSNAGMLTVAALFVVAAAMRETGTLDLIGNRMLGQARTERSAMLRLAGCVTVMSAFLNNTPIVAMFMPLLTKWCKNRRIAPSRLLLPLSYFTILGGTCTLIGTSTNLVVNGLIQEAAIQHPELAGPLRPMSLFELGRVGLPYAIVGIAYLMIFAPRLLPERKDLIEQLSESAREYLINMRVAPACPLIGRTIEAAGLRHLPGLYLVEIRRNQKEISPVPPDEQIEAGDELTFTGIIGTIVDLENIPGLEALGEEERSATAVERRSRVLCEAVISSTSPCIGRKVRETDFRALYNAAIVAVHRGGGRLAGKVGEIVLRAGDTLLLQAGLHFVRANRNNPDFLLVSRIEDSRPVRHEKTWLAGLLMMALIVLMATGWLRVELAAFLVGALMVAGRCISMADARRSIDWQTLITIAAALGVGKGLENSGLVTAISEMATGIAGQFGPIALLVCVYLITGIFTEMVTNNAAAALVFPFAVGFAIELGVSPRPFIMAVTFAASASFMTPLGYQTNMMVFGPGGYRIIDYVRLGAPLHFLLLICAALLIPIAWPF